MQVVFRAFLYVLIQIHYVLCHRSSFPSTCSTMKHYHDYKGQAGILIRITDSISLLVLTGIQHHYR